MKELELIDTLEAHLQTILWQQGLQRIWGEKPNTYIVYCLDLQRCFHEVIQRVWYQKLGGEVNPYTLEGQLVFQLEDASYALAHVFLYRSHVANAPTGVQRHRKGEPPPPDWLLLARRYSTYLDITFEKLYTFWNHQATLSTFDLARLSPGNQIDLRNELRARRWAADTMHE